MQYTLFLFFVGCSIIALGVFSDLTVKEVMEQKTVHVIEDKK